MKSREEMINFMRAKAELLAAEFPEDAARYVAVMPTLEDPAWEIPVRTFAVLDRELEKILGYRPQSAQKVHAALRERFGYWTLGRPPVDVIETVRAKGRIENEDEAICVQQFLDGSHGGARSTDEEYTTFSLLLRSYHEGLHFPRPSRAVSPGTPSSSKEGKLIFLKAKAVAMAAERPEQAGQFMLCTKSLELHLKMIPMAALTLTDREFEHDFSFMSREAVARVRSSLIAKFGFSSLSKLPADIVAKALSSGLIKNEDEAKCVDEFLSGDWGGDQVSEAERIRLSEIVAAYEARLTRRAGGSAGASSP